MPRADRIETEGRVMEVRPNGICRVELPNGHRILAYRGRRLRGGTVRIETGDVVVVEMSPFDMSRGCIVNRKQ